MARGLNGTAVLSMDQASSFLFSHVYTISCWFYVTNVTSFQCIMQLGDFTASLNEVYMFVQSSNLRSGTSGAGGMIISRTLNNNQWYHGCLVSSAINSRKLYLNGLTATVTTTDTPSTTPGDWDSIGLGVRNLISFRFNQLTGRLAEPALWNYNLSDSEVDSLAKGISPRLIRPKQLIWHKDLVRDFNRPYIGGNVAQINGVTTVQNHVPMHYGGE